MVIGGRLFVGRRVRGFSTGVMPETTVVHTSSCPAQICRVVSVLAAPRLLGPQGSCTVENDASEGMLFRVIIDAKRCTDKVYG